MRLDSGFYRLLGLLAFVVSQATAQTGSASISGQVTDASGAAVSGASIKIRNVQTGSERAVQSNTPGIYVADILPPGEYEITAQAPGFKPSVHKGIVLVVDQRARQDIRLEIGSVQESVEVIAHAEQYLKPVSSDLGEVIGEKAITELPLNGRSVNDLIALNAGVSTTTNSFFKGVGVDLSLNGQRSSTNAFLIEGMDNVEFAGQSPNTVLQVDAVSEFNILTNNFAAEYGRATGGVVNVYMRSGTNAFHGTLFEFLRNDKLDANGFFANRVGGTKLPYRFNQFGGSLGGPIRRNKAFFFADYQATHTRTGNTAILSVPPLAWRSGDFATVPSAVIYDPTNVTGQVGAFPQRMPFAGNAVPAGRQNLVAKNLLALYPAPNRPGTIFNYINPLRQSSNGHKLDAKIDHHSRDNNVFSGRYNFSNTDNHNDPNFGDTGGGGTVPSSNVGNQNAAASFTRIVTPAIVNEARFGYVRRVGNTKPSGYGRNLDDQVGIPSINGAPTTSGLANIVPTGFDVLGGQVFFPQLTEITTRQFLDNITISRGHHNLKTGGDFRLRSFNLFQAGYARGYFAFDTLTTSQAQVGGNSIASLLLGLPSNAQRDFLDHYIEQRGWEVGTFFQDDIRVSRALTLNLGMRYDVFTPFLDTHDRQANFNMTTRTMDMAGKNGVSRRLLPTDTNNVAPRVGFAYLLTRDQKTALRGGYGVSYFAEQNALATLDRSGYNIPFYYLYTVAQTGAMSVGQSITTILANIPPADPTKPFGKVGYRAPTLHDSYSQTWNLDLQRALTRSMVLDVAYSGSHGVHLLGLTNPNQPAPGPVRVFPVSSAIGNLFTMDSRSNSIYHSVQLKLNKRFADGLAFLASYTYGKSIDDSVGYWPNSGTSQMPQDSRAFGRAERALADWDIRHRFVLSHNWQIPVGRGRRFLTGVRPAVNHVLGGWQLTGITTVNSGTPVSAYIATNRANTAFGGPLRPIALRSPHLPQSERSVDHWFDKTAFVLPASFTYGNSGRNVLTGPGLVNFDWGMFKNFPVAEKKQLQFRTECFNLFNTPHFGLPNSFIDTLQGGTINILSAPPRQIQFALKLLF